MKRFKVVHQTTYEYSDDVQLGAHTLRLRPREGHDQHLESSTLSISPGAELRWHRDVESNSVAIARFTEASRKLQIECNSIIQKFDVLPQDFLIEDYAVNYPFCYPTEDAITLAPYLRSNTDEDNILIKNWLNNGWASQQPKQTFELLLSLNQYIYQTLNYVKRDEEGVQSAQTTLSKNAGSCRDYANLFIDAARYLGFAARFVSGYVHTEDDHHLSGTTHAWAEVFIPGAGWKGFDPTHGSLVGLTHIAVAVSRLPELVPAVSGAFWGLPGSSLKVDVWVTEIG
ncbi:transglutaminase family protein [Alteromonas lipolytica]|uniref:Cysteine protease n=1 Tax=Alteromonas lipolytica TaxID=1856405 RepID=A0A1E8FA98_9ALTE|nr:transglutaminase family protein [Alteromonas lipolytica]OFI32840.1 cysteine protease [Alteromonas lipolytica]